MINTIGEGLSAGLAVLIIGICVCHLLFGLLSAWWDWRWRRRARRILTPTRKKVVAFHCTPGHKVYRHPTFIADGRASTTPDADHGSSCG